MYHIILPLPPSSLGSPGSQHNGPRRCIGFVPQGSLGIFFLHFLSWQLWRLHFSWLWVQIHFQSITHFLCGRESQEQCCTCQPPCKVFAWKCFFSCNIFCNHYHDGSYLPQAGKMKRKFGPLPSQEVRLNPGQSRSDQHSYKSKVWPAFAQEQFCPVALKI